MLARCKLNSTETLISRALIKLKENIRMIKRDDELNEKEDKRIKNNKIIGEYNENA